MNWSLLTNLGNITFQKNWHSVRRDNQHLKIKKKNHTTTNDILYTKIYGKGFRYNVLVIMYTFSEFRVPQATLRSIVFFFLQKFCFYCNETRRGRLIAKACNFYPSVVLQNLKDEVDARPRRASLSLFYGSPWPLGFILLLLVWY